MNDGVILLDSVLCKGTTKFSSKGEDNYSVVHITISHGKCSMKCTNGMCLAVTQTKKKLPKSTGIKEVDLLCSHLRTMAENMDYAKSFSHTTLCKDKITQKKTQLKWNKRI